MTDQGPGKDISVDKPILKREELSKHRWVEEDLMKSGWYLNNGTGTWQGYYCN